MSLKAIDKRLIIKASAGDVTERMFDYLEDVDRKKRQKVIDLLRSFSIFGFMVQELGGGVVDSMLSMEANGELDAMTDQQKAAVLISKLELISGTSRKKPVGDPVKPDEVEQEEPRRVKKKTLDDLDLDMD